MKSFVRLILLLFVPLALVTGYALSPYELGEGDYMLEKADLSTLTHLFSFSSSSGEQDEMRDVTSPMSVAEDTQAFREDSLPSDALLAVIEPQEQLPDSATTEVKLSSKPKAVSVAAPDTTRLRVMIFGDSMAEWMVKRLCDYTMEADYDLSSIIWYSSSTKLWAETDTLEYFLQRIRPDYILLCLGSNELFIRDIQKRDKYVESIVSRISHRPFVWISPPNWRPDTGINDLIIKHVGAGRYFDSRGLELERASDNVHPSKESAFLWADTICSWLRSDACRTPLPLFPPREQRRRHYHSYVLKPVH